MDKSGLWDMKKSVNNFWKRSFELNVNGYMAPKIVTVHKNRLPTGATARAMVKKTIVGMVGEAKTPFLWRCLWVFRSLRYFVRFVSAFTKRKSFRVGCLF